MRFSYKIDGLKQLDRSLSQLGDRAERRIGRASVVSALRSVRRQFVQAAPKGIETSETSERYGSIRKNIRVQRSRSRFPEAVIHTGRAFWALFYERGTKNQPARPWFDPLFQSLAPQILRKLFSDVSSGIVKEWNKR